jgi:hypothetical protein
LTVPESERIVESLLPFKSSDERSECPGFVLAAPVNSPRLFLQVKGFCPPDGFAGSTTIGNFEVDRSTGAVTVWPSGQPIAEPKETAGLARTLVAQARDREISEWEAECLARLAARGESALADPLTVVRVNRNTEHEMVFSIRYPLAKPRSTAVRFISVDTSSFAVMDVGRGQGIHFRRVDELLSRLLEARESPSLSAAETIEVASAVPSIATQISSECSPQLSSDFGTSHIRFVEVQNACDPYPRASRVVAAVDSLTGVVTEPRTRKVLDTPESVGLVQILLARAKERQAAAKLEIEHICQEAGR